MFSEVSQTKNKYHKFISYHLYVESKRIKQMNIQNRNRFAHIDYKLVFTSRHKEGGSSKIGIVD